MKRTLHALLLIAALGLGSLLPRPLPAIAVAPTTTTVDLSTTFQTSGQSLWKPGDASDISKDVAVIDKAWNTSLNVDPLTLFFVKFGPKLAAATSGSIGLTVRFHLNSGAVSVSYPVTVHLTSPAAKSFKPGDTVTISSQWSKP